MDHISLAIVVTVFSLGSVLVYLIKSDFERRNSPQVQLASSRRNSSKPKVDKIISPHLGPAKSISTASVYEENIHQAVKHILNNPKQQSGQNHEKKATTNKAHGSKSAHSSPKMVESKNSAIKRIDSMEKREENGPEPPLDELDSSILLEVFNPTNTKSRVAKMVNSQPMERKVSTRKKQSSERSDLAYSSEHLFNIIAATNLTREEVEMAVETLLNKIDSGESDWKRPKSDPMQRLKNQLHDNEVALTIEVQKHEQTRVRLAEMRAQLQSEKSSNSSAKEELGRLKKEVLTLGLALEQTRCELSKQHVRSNQIKEESAKAIARLEKDNVQLQTVFADLSAKDAELKKLRNESDDKAGYIQRQELSAQTMAEKLQDLEDKLHSAELQLDQMRAAKNQDEYEACAKISELELERARLDKALKDNMARLKEATEKYNLLENSVKELQLINGRQDDMLKRLRDERHLNETAMKRTLCEMELELKQLQSKLNASSASHEERLRREMSHVERELNIADQREQKLVQEMKELREGLAKLLPNISEDDALKKSDDWVQRYLSAVRQLAKSVEEFQERESSYASVGESPTKASADKSTLTSRTNGTSSRVGSPFSNGRSSRGKSGQSRN